MRAILAFVLSVAVGAIASAQDAPAGKRFSPRDAGFDVVFPAEPTLRDTSDGTDTIHVATGPQRKKVEDLYLTCHWIVNEKLRQEKNVPAYLLGVVQGAVQASKGKLLENKEIALNGFPGRQYIIEVNDRNTMATRVYFAGDRVIYVGVVGNDHDAVTGAEARQFLDSLRIQK
ncbi:MAG: hypothetical protein C0483_12120 [Pirellula sp.]|nr:hypothetical protein [Pirellula sp.]